MAQQIRIDFGEGLHAYQLSDLHFHLVKMLTARPGGGARNDVKRPAKQLELDLSRPADPTPVGYGSYTHGADDFPE